MRAVFSILYFLLFTIYYFVFAGVFFSFWFRSGQLWAAMDGSGIRCYRFCYCQYCSSESLGGIYCRKKVEFEINEILPQTSKFTKVDGGLYGQ